MATGVPAYGRDGQLGLPFALALSEYHLLLGRYVDAHGQAEKAILHTARKLARLDPRS